MDNDYKELTDRLIASIDDLMSAPLSDEEKRELLDEAIRRIVWPYKSAAAARCKLDTGQDDVYSKKNKIKGFGYIKRVWLYIRRHGNGQG